MQEEEEGMEGNGEVADPDAGSGGGLGVATGVDAIRTSDARKVRGPFAMLV